MKIFGLVGWSGSGKTTLVIELLPELIGRGLSVSTMKHTHHRFDVDKPGKDSFRHRQAGASEVMVVSSQRWALMHELRGAPEPSMDEMVEHMSPVDLLLIEGFKSHAHPKMEVHRPAVGKPLLATDDQTVVAVATDDPGLEATVPLFDLNDVAGIADFIIDYCGLQTERKNDAA